MSPLTRLPSSPAARGLRGQKSQNTKVGYFSMYMSALILHLVCGVCPLDRCQSPASWVLWMVRIYCWFSDAWKIEVRKFWGRKFLILNGPQGMQCIDWNQIYLMTHTMPCIVFTVTDSKEIYLHQCFLDNDVLLYLFAEHKVIIVGLDNAGKTTILYQL